ncbi:hypothetical protein PW5551_04030 [Petrotoga sp. 9PW.55.5.1]|uniref:hypothetical protein n=1 Tax=unclassified Petrotoga TaxID=2620614 RepID=UPI000CBC4B42|nr:MULTISPECIES: hypothetical protein [unclassified Petrotoga]PNR89053.1 hypothetical protein X925_04100 [Petrotoga sp. 9T1HF07.CasAA.8.2]RAO99416.1 hypothetical protein PW5551_04030 [Petrotoga sp. 9PW.55.5.1]
MPLKLVTKLSTCGQFGRSFMNYLESISLNDKTITNPLEFVLLYMILKIITPSKRSTTPPL